MTFLIHDTTQVFDDGTWVVVFRKIDQHPYAGGTTRETSLVVSQTPKQHLRQAPEGGKHELEGGSMG